MPPTRPSTTFGNVHVVCNNAGMGILGPVTVAHYDDWDWGLGVLLGGVVNGIQTFLPRLLAHGEGGHIVNTSSMAGVLPIPGAAIYITAKAALIGLSEALRSELAPEGIGVSAFCPGPVQTNIREGGRTRPERYGDSGYAELERELEERPNSPLWMDPLECGERVLEGIRRDDLYIFTHREFREGADERFRAMLASFPDEPRDEERAEAISFLLSNEIFREVLEPAAQPSRRVSDSFVDNFVRAGLRSSDRTSQQRADSSSDAASNAGRAQREAWCRKATSTACL